MRCEELKVAKLSSVWWALTIAGLLCLSLCSCTSRRSAKNDAESVGNKDTKVNAVSAAHGIDLNCVMDHIQNPPGNFHYSYKKDSSNPVYEEADITPQTIDGSFTNGSGSHPVHGVKSDAQSWQGAWTGLMGIAGMSSAVALVKSGSVIQSEGAEKVNGYDTTKYSVDTSRADTAEQGLYRATLGSGGFEKGTWWVTAEGCPVKLSLDSELRSNNGSVEKLHYEEAMVQK
jgi:hypothetical protein